LIGTMMKPPFTSLTKYDLNTGVIAWQVGLGNHAGLAALGITGTGTPQMRGSMIVTAGGLLFAPGGDGQVRAFDTDTGNVVWAAALGGAIRGAPAMYEIDGRQYLLVSASGDSPETGLPPNGAAATNLPKGYVAFALPKK
jgi:quinoprotein glucose dehydrogenase